MKPINHRLLKPNSTKAFCATLWTSSTPYVLCVIANTCGNLNKRVNNDCIQVKGSL